MLKSTHELLMKIERLQNERDKNELHVARMHNNALNHMVTSQQETIKTLTQELVVLRGVVRPKVERDPEEEAPTFQPDIAVETDDGTFKQMSQKQIEDARRDFESLMANLAPEIESAAFKEVDPALVAAQPRNEEEWRAEHEEQ